MTSRSYSIFYFFLIFAIMVTSLLYLIAGPLGLSVSIISWGQSFNDPIFLYRIQRLILALIAGSSLAASGATLQAIFKNHLADPHLFGISGGAAVGASLVIAISSGEFAFGTNLGAILGGVGSFLLVFLYLKKIKDGPISYCLLVGILVNSVASAIITLLKTLLPATKSQSLLFWLVGHIEAVNRYQLLLILPLWLIGLSLLFNIKGQLEIMSFGLDEGQMLGVNVEKVIRVAIVANSILIGNVVSFAGMIGFLGLVIPHMIRIFIVPDLRLMLPFATLLGALCMVVFDGLSRISFFFLHTEIPSGVLSALVLSPVFFFLLLKSAKDA